MFEPSQVVQDIRPTVTSLEISSIHRRQAFHTLAGVDGKVSRTEVRNALGSRQMHLGINWIMESSDGCSDDVSVNGPSSPVR